MTEDTAAPADDENRKREELQDAAELAADTLGHDLLQALVNELQATKEWASRSEQDQNASIERLRVRVHKLVGEALNIMLLQEYPVVVATVAGVRFQKGIRVVLAVDKHAQSRHELADAEGKSVLVLIADPDELREGMGKIRAAAKQGELFSAGPHIGDNYTGGDERPYRRDEPGMTDGAVPDAGSMEIAVEPGQPHAFVGDVSTGKDLCRICGKPVEEDIHTTPVAPADLELERDLLWKQAVVALAGIGCEVFENIAQSWNEQQCTEAMYYVTLAKEGKGKPEMPKFVHEALCDQKGRRRRKPSPADDTQ